MDRQNFTGQFGFIMASAGAAVGLGNIWSYPRCASQGGGVVFLALYVLLNALIGYPLLMAELAMGRDTRCRPAGAFRAMGKSGLGGYLGQLASLLMMGFYSVLGGCCIRYMLVNFRAVMAPEETAGLSLFLGYISNVPLSAFYTVIFIVMACLVIMAGVTGGLERFAKVAMPLLMLMLPGLILCALSLPGAEKGLESLFAVPQPGIRSFAELAMPAFVQMFFSLSIGQAVMLTYGSYMPPGIKLPRCAAAVVFADTFIAILASFAVVPAAHAAGGSPGDGAMMMFVTMQKVFDSCGAWGNLFGALFYLLVLLAALTSAVSLLEVVSFFAGEGAGRKSAAVFAAALSAIPAVAIARDGMGFGALPEIFGMSWLSAAEFVSEGILMPLCALLMIRALHGARGEALLRRQLGAAAGNFTRICVVYISPVLIVPVMLIKLFSN